MADAAEQLALQLEVIGDKQAAAAVRRLNKGIDATSSKTQQLAALQSDNVKITKQAASAQGMLATRNARAATAATKAATAQNNLTKRTKAASVASGLMGDRSRKLGREIGGTTNIIAEMGFSLGTVIPSMRNTGTQMAIAGGSAQQLGSMFGVAGAAAGILTGAVPLLVSALFDAEEQIDATRKAVEKIPDSVREALEAIDETVSAREEIRRLAQIERGAGEVEEQQSALDQTRVALRETRQEMEAFRKSEERAREELEKARNLSPEDINLPPISRETPQQIINQEIEAAERRLEQVRAGEEFNKLLKEEARLQRDLADAKKDVRRAEEGEGETGLAGLPEAPTVDFPEPSDAPTPPPRGGRGGGGRAEPRGRRVPEIDPQQTQAMRERAAAIEKIEQVLTQTQQEQAERRQAARRKERQSIIRESEALRQSAERTLEESQRTGRRIDAQLRELEESADRAATRFADSWRKGVDEVIAATDRLQAANMRMGRSAVSTGNAVAKAAQGASVETAQAMGGTMKSGIEEAVGAWVSGEKSIKQAAAAMMKGVIQSVLQQSIVQAIFQTAQGIAALATFQFDKAGQHFAAAAVFGAAAAAAGAVGAATGSVGGGGGKSGGGSTSTGPAPEPKRDRERDVSRNVVINVGTEPVSTEADIGRAVRRSLQAAEVEDGTTV